MWACSPDCWTIANCKLPLPLELAVVALIVVILTGSALKWGTAWGTCYLNNNADRCDHPLCERMAINIQGEHCLSGFPCMHLSGVPSPQPSKSLWNRPAHHYTCTTWVRRVSPGEIQGTERTCYKRSLASQETFPSVLDVSHPAMLCVAAAPVLALLCYNNLVWTPPLHAAAAIEHDSTPVCFAVYPPLSVVVCYCQVDCTRLAPTVRTSRLTTVSQSWKTSAPATATNSLPGGSLTLQVGRVMTMAATTRTTSSVATSGTT